MSENFLNSQFFVAFHAYKVRTKRTALEELAAPCNRFLSPLTTEEKFRLFLTQKLGAIDMLENATHVIGSGILLNWLALLRYLHEQNILREPRLRYVPCRNDLPKAYYPRMVTKWDKDHTDGRMSDIAGYAHSTNAEMALSKAVGETLERYYLSVFKYDSLIRASYADISKRGALNIFDMPSFRPEERKADTRLVQNTDTPLLWVQGETIEGKPAYIPAQHVYWTYDFHENPEETILVQPTTNGAAGHFTKEEAIVAALLENIQRDGFLIYWLNHMSPPVIDVSTIQDKEIQDFLASAERYGLTVYFLNTTSDIRIPSVTCAIVDARMDDPIISVGGGTGFNLRDTILHSAEEALVVLNFIEQQNAFSIPDDFKSFADERIGQMERLTAWKGKDMYKRFEFFIKGRRQEIHEFMNDTEQYTTPESRLQYIVEQFKKAGSNYQIYVYEVQNEVLKKLGYHVVQTVVPPLLPLYLNENFATLDSKRLREVPALLGFKAAASLNPWPHPFP